MMEDGVVQSPCTPGARRERSPAHGMQHVDPAVIMALQKHVPAMTAQCIQDTLGISANTWKKLREGLPIRRSVAERLLIRTQSITNLKSR